MNQSRIKSSSPILLFAALQGWALYGLHLSIENKVWPATDLSWLVPLYAISIFVPLTLQMLAEQLLERSLWATVSMIAALAGLLGAYAGWSVSPATEKRYWGEGSSFSLGAFYATFFVIWYIGMPFVQAWFRRKNRSFAYRDLFEFSWQNILLLSEAGLFTAIFWALLGLCAALFKIVDISFFAELFLKPAFIYPITAIVYGYAIYLINVRESIVVTLRRHLLGVFSWLLPLVVLIALLFLVVLPKTGLAPLWKTGHASLLVLWLQVLFIHFLNAAYEDGSREPSYPGWLKFLLRLAVFSIPIYVAICAYSMGLRIEQYGLSVERVWAALVTLVVGLYGVGYCIAALRSSPWMHRVAPINITMAFVVATLLILVLSPALDPRRLTVNNQLARLASGQTSPDKFDFDYFRFGLGRYGISALTELSKGSNTETARLAALSLAKSGRFMPGNIQEPPVELSTEEIGRRINVYPSGTSLDPHFLEFLQQTLKDQSGRWKLPPCLNLSEPSKSCLVLSTDLNRDGQPEIIFLDLFPRPVYSNVDGKWQQVGTLTGKFINHEQMKQLLDNSQIQTESPVWLGLKIGNDHYAIEPVSR